MEVAQRLHPGSKFNPLIVSGRNGGQSRTVKFILDWILPTLSTILGVRIVRSLPRILPGSRDEIFTSEKKSSKNFQMTLITVSFIDVKLLLSENTAQTTHQRVIIVILGLRQSLNQFFLLAGLI